MLIAAAGLGRPALAGCRSTILSVELDECLVAGEQVVAEVWISNADGGVTGTQFTLAYSTAHFDLVDVEPGDAPLTYPLYEDSSVPGALVYAVVQLSPGQGAQDDLVAAYVTFEVVGEGGYPFIRFQETLGGTIVITDDGGNHAPQLQDASPATGLTIRDFADFQVCHTGEGVSASNTCACWYDYDNDGDVDDADYETFAATMGNPVGWSCTP